MADATKKAQKLAAARKKLKEYQQKIPKSIKNEDNPASSVTTTNSSRHSSISNGNGADYTSVMFNECETEQQQTSPFYNYFNGNQQNNFYIENQEMVQVTDFFNNLSAHDSLSSNNFIEPTVTDNYQIELNMNDKSLDYPEVESRSVYGFYPQEEHPSVSSEDAKRLSDFLRGNDTNSENPVPISIHHDTSVPSVFHKPYSPESASQEVITEQLNPIHELLNESIPHELETQVKEYQFKVQQLEDQLALNKMEHEHKLNTELESLQERLQGHVKTIEMYIAENNQLTESWLQNQATVKQKTSECEELQGRLKASRTRVSDLEKEMQIVKVEKTKLDQGHVYEAELNHLKKQFEELKQLKDETAQDVLELREKLNIKANENIGLQRELQEVTHQLSLAQIKIEQISVGDTMQGQAHIAMISQQKVELEKQIVNLSQSLKSVNEEKAQTNLQYQQYVQQLNTQVAQLANKVETLSIENESLTKREQSLVKHISELEKHLQIIQETKIDFTNEGSVEIKKELDATSEFVVALRKEKEELQEKYEHICGDQEDLIAELAGKKDVIEQLENELERLKVDQPNTVKLLAVLESDKVAASRAVTQNTTLKKELEEMQQAFVRMSNDKLDLTEQLSSEKFRTYELQERLNSLETKLQTLSDAIEIKDNELTHVRETLTHQSKQLLQSNQLTDRLRHYEAQDGSSVALQQELQKAQDEIVELATENLKLRTEISTINEAETLKSNAKLITDETPESDLPVMVKETQTPSEELNCLTLDDSLDKEIAMKHLEDKFTHTMKDIANLTEEKQRLEHIVMQLQGETDTIGEYIALYQHQRGILQQRTQEREEQLKILTNDRINVKNKLEMINDLVNKLVCEKDILSPEILEQHNALCNQSHEEHSTHEENENNNISSQTAGQIIQLISEIKSSNLVQPSDAVGAFHPCSCCSGQLYTV